MKMMTNTGKGDDEYEDDLPAYTDELEGID